MIRCHAFATNTEMLVNAAYNGACRTLLDLQMVTVNGEYDEEATDTATSADWQTPDPDWPQDAFSNDVLLLIQQDVEDFIRNNARDFFTFLRHGTDREATARDFGTHFILTRNGHGAGFWDLGLGDLGDRLSVAARAYGALTAEADVDDTEVSTLIN